MHFALLLQKKLRRCCFALAGVSLLPHSKRCQSKSKRKIAPLDFCVVFKIGRKKQETIKKIEIIFSNIVFVLPIDVVVVVVV